MAVYRYWRLTVPQVSSGLLVALASVELVDAVAGVDVAPLSTVTANTEAPGYPPTRLTDGSVSTFWQAAAVNHEAWVQFDFGGTPRDIVSCTVRDIPTNSAERVTNCLLLYSADGVQWRPMVPGIATGGLPLGGASTSAVAQAGVRVVQNAVLPRLNTAWPAVRTVRAGPGPVTFDASDGGGYRIAGTVYLDATPDMPLRRRVRLFDQESGRFVRQVWSDGITGGYAFEKIRGGMYFVVAHDYALEHNAVIRDRIEALPMVAA